MDAWIYVWLSKLIQANFKLFEEYLHLTFTFTFTLTTHVTETKIKGKVWKKS